LGGDTSQLTGRPWTRTESVVTTYDRPGGNETNKAVSMRGIVLFRQIEQVQIIGNGFWIHFGNDARPLSFEMQWKKLEPMESHKVATPDEIVSWIKSGKAVTSQPIDDLTQAKELTITQIIPRYKSSSLELLHPYAEIELVADLGSTNRVVVNLDCPVIETEKAK